MKKLLTLFAVAFFSMITMQSCLDDGNGSSATLSYFGVCDSIEYTDSTNARLDSLIKMGMYKLGCTYTPFEEEASSEESQMMFAIAKCHDQAMATWKGMVNRLTLKDIANAVYSQYSDTLSQYLGIHSSTELALKPFTVKTVLYSTQYGDAFFTYERKVE